MVVTPSRFLLRYDTSSNWGNSSYALYAGELGFSYDNSDFKIGDDTTLWSTLPSIDFTPSYLSLVNDVYPLPSTIADGSIFAYYNSKAKWAASHSFVTVDPITYAIDYSIDNLDDVDITSTPLTEGDILVWQSTSGLWENKPVIMVNIENITAPINATDTGVTGEIRYDANYIYICTSSNSWKRFNLVTW